MTDINYLDPVDDGLILRDSKIWTKDKLHYINEYLNRFLISQRNKPWRSINYIDLFSGPGKCIIKKTSEILLGSPLTALKLPRGFDKYYFADLKKINIEALRSRSSKSSYYSRIKFICGDANLIVRDVMAEILEQDKTFIQDKWSTLNISILDPDGLDLSWATVESLAKANRMDLIIYYSQMGITRSAPKVIDSSRECAIDKFFGNREWRNIYKKSLITEKGLLHRNLIDFYKSNLSKLGYCQVETNEPREINSKNSPLYRLIFASKHSLAANFWNESVSKNVNGQGKLFN